ncbi:protein mono-ADP-ribosyltransferase TIPARP-like isoform X2 [Mauremys mutica]|uniref:protein mono-ADP-ribosyltransferase TIPARP-like isoform X2 n=1 Tax=Mauremys mutica TaxID=74926 RepID=UPI001D15D8F9|nr:protein mono-ADP-ribosyltransferase TIPARP-like isoform X2 [Mauremys mutica]
MGQRISIGIFSQFGGSPQKKISPADPEQKPVAKGTHAIHRRPQQGLSSSDTVSPGSPTSPRADAAPQSPSPLPAKRWCSFPPSTERWVSEDGVPFHVHQEDGIQICDGFLLGHCPQKENCPLHHTRYPFHWQIMGSRRVAWQSLSDSSQRHLEKLYSDAKNGFVRFLDRNRLFGILDLDTMELGYWDAVNRVRRLGSASDWKQNPRFHTRWQVYWKHRDTWQRYKEGQLYTLDLRPPLQSPEGLGSVQPIQIQRRPAYRSLSCMARYLRTVPRGSQGLFHPSTSIIPGERPTDGYCGPYPAAWVPQPPCGQAFLHAELAPSEAVYREICELFHASLPEDTVLVLRIYRIRNDALWKKYSSQKERMSRGLSAQEKRLLERHLFHGTSADNVEPICRLNFNPHLSGKHGAHYGRGSYFSFYANCSHNFALANHAGRRHMFLAKVLVGKWVLGRPGYTQPPAREPGRRRYDSCSDDAREPAVYVIFDNSQCYPYFMICYKLLSDPVTLDGVRAGPLAGNRSPAGRLMQPGVSTL